MPSSRATTATPWSSLTRCTAASLNSAVYTCFGTLNMPDFLPFRRVYTRPLGRRNFRGSSAKGEARFFHTNAYKGQRTNDRHSKEDLPPDLARSTREGLMERLQTEGWDMSNTKVLMLTHNVLAAEQGYPNIAEIFSGRTDLFTKKEDPAI